MREVLDRLREAETALDKQLMELYYMPDTGKRTYSLTLLWKAKQSIWFAQMHALNAAAGKQPSGYDK